mmetsp:Transcript_23551/g.26121  ORF Transcript_23551/g.26121 Transcript_23551/m.26121 type:complete len:166 (+) Transcript_23551:43-540(+)
MLARINTIALTGRRTTSYRQPAKKITVTRNYHERVIDHFNHPKNVGSLDKKSKSVGTGLVGAPACADVMKMDIQVEDGVIVDSKFRTYGCASAIASSSLATEWIKGKTIEEALEIKNQQIAKHLSLPPVKRHCSMLAEDAIRSAIRNYKQKNEEEAAPEQKEQTV